MGLDQRHFCLYAEGVFCPCNYEFSNVKIDYVLLTTVSFPPSLCSYLSICLLHIAEKFLRYRRLGNHCVYGCRAVL